MAAAVLAGLLVSGGSAWLRELGGDAPGTYALLLALVLELAVLPPAWYRTFAIERQYGLVRAPFRVWCRDYGRGVAWTVVAAVVASEILYRSMRLWPAWWWLPAATAGTLLVATLMWVAPVAILRAWRPGRPLTREGLSHRLAHLARHLGIETPAVHESGSAAYDRRVHASIVGVGRTPRILLSSTLLADYTDDEIEAVVAHEIGHHVHRDGVITLLAWFVVLLAGLSAASAALERAWQPLGLTSPADPAGLPLLLIVAGGTHLLALPFLNGLSRRSERRADRFALEITGRPEALISAVRRMAAQNLVEERPSPVVFCLFHRHPRVEDRIAAAGSPRYRTTSWPFMFRHRSSWDRLQ